MAITHEKRTLKNLKKYFSAAHKKSVMLKFVGSTLNDVARMSVTKFSGHTGRHFDFFFNLKKI